jgi:hypothetical protein
MEWTWAMTHNDLYQLVTVLLCLWILIGVIWLIDEEIDRK